MRQVQEKHQARKKLYYALVDLEMAFDSPDGGGKMGVDEGLMRTAMAWYTEACTVVITDAGLSKSFEVKVGLH